MFASTVCGNKWNVAVAPHQEVDGQIDPRRGYQDTTLIKGDIGIITFTLVLQ